MGCHALLQGIFLNQGLNPSLQHGRQILYCLSHQGSSTDTIGVPNGALGIRQHPEVTSKFFDSCVSFHVLIPKNVSILKILKTTAEVADYIFQAD